jgi:hypothetical protein
LWKKVNPDWNADKNNDEIRFDNWTSEEIFDNDILGRAKIIVMMKKCKMSWTMERITDDSWLCNWTEACAVNMPNFSGEDDYEVARLYSAAVRRFMEYWTNNVKTIEIGKLVESKSRVIKK